MIVVLLGPPGAGKGTQCKRVADRYGLVHLSSGDILRAERAAGSELGEKAQSYMDSGGLVPDDVIIEMMVGAMKQAEDSCLLDGFPRTVVQGEQLDKALEQSGGKVDAVINLGIADEIITNRMTGRRSCTKCGAVYHIENLKPKVEGICDNDGEVLVQREDDKAEVVANRLKIYYEQTAAVVDYYKNAGKVVFDIDAGGDIEDVTVAIVKSIDGLSATEAVSG